MLIVPAAGGNWTGNPHLDQMSRWDYPLGGALLVHQPRYVDILPLYIVFLLGAPVLLHAYRKGWQVPVLLTSVGVWCVGWLPIRSPGPGSAGTKAVPSTGTVVRG